MNDELRSKICKQGQKLGWILGQYKEKKPTHSTIAEALNTYKVKDYKKKFVGLSGGFAG